MFQRVTLEVSDLAQAVAVYDRLLEILEIGRDGTSPVWKDFGLAQADDPARPTRRLHIGFAAPSVAHIERFWQAGQEAGYRDDGAPGPRPQYRDDYVGGFLRDSQGNSIEAVHHGAMREQGAIDHLWIRVADLDASTRFYEHLIPHADRLRVRRRLPGRTQFAGESGSFSLVDDGPPTERMHLALWAAGDEAYVNADPDRNTVQLVPAQAG